MDEMECVHGLGPVSACVLCNGRARREAKQEALERELDGDRKRRIAAVMAAKARAEERQMRRFHRVRDGAWESPGGLSDDLMLPGGMIDERGPITGSQQRPRASQRIEGFLR